MRLNLNKFKIWWFGHTCRPISNKQVYAGLVSCILSIFVGVVYVIALINWVIHVIFMSESVNLMTSGWSIVCNISCILIVIALLIQRD